MSGCVLFGWGASARVARALDALGSRRPLLVTGGRSFERSGAAARLGTALAPFEVAGRFHDFDENPRIEDVERGLAIYRATGPDAVVAVGGGSVLDMAKLVNGLAGQQAAPAEIIRGTARPVERRVPFVALPTTAGSGSEATHFAVVYIGKAKYSFAAPWLLPDVAIVDPALTASASPALTAVTGMDAFAQAVESYWSVHSTPESKALAARAIRLVFRHLPAAVHTPTRASRRGMSKAAHLAGRAINITKTTGAHAMSYPLTSYFGIPHGHAVALTLGRWLLFNSAVTDRDVADPRGAAYVRETLGDLLQLLESRDAEEGCRRIEDLVRSVGLGTRLTSLGVSRAQAIDVVVPNVNLERVVNNPRTMTPEGLRDLIEAVC